MELPFNIDKDLLSKKLTEKGINPNCSSCGRNNWAVLDEATLIPQWINRLPAPGIPAAAMICNNCGFVRHHALGALGMLPDSEGENE